MKSGVYKITNTINNKFYIGSAINLGSRKSSHFSKLQKNTHSNIHLQRSYNKNGNVFKFEILENCNINELIEKEQFYIDTLKPEYNILKNAKNLLGYRHTQDAKEKIRVSKIGNTNMLGKTHTEESKRKIGSGNLGKKCTKSSIKKRVDKIKKPVVQLSKNNEFIQEFDSATDAQNILGVNRSSISSCCKQYSKHAGNFKWVYKKDYNK